jgi:two-component system LytT family response regulator
MSLVRVLSVENERAARRQLRSLVSLDPECELIGECQTGMEAVSSIDRTRPDILFVDVQSPEMDAFAISRVISEPRPLIIFTSECDEFAARAFEARAFDYLLKPFERARFENALDRAKAEIARNNPLVNVITRPQMRQTKIAVRQNGRVLLLSVEQIDWIEAADNYVQLHCGRETYVLRQAMNDVETRLASMGFVRIHRCAIANIDRIKELQPWFRGDHRVVLRDGTTLPLTKTHLEKLDQYLLMGSFGGSRR